MENRDLNTLRGCVEGWAMEKGIWGGNFMPQFVKFQEEVQELSNELIDMTSVVAKSEKGGMMEVAYSYESKEYIDHDAMQKELGDVLVALIILASKLDTTVEECLGKAYDKIAKRTGKVVNGTFIKSEDLPQ